MWMTIRLRSITGTLAAISVEGCTAAERPAATNTLAYLRGEGLIISDACGDAGLAVTSSDGAPSESCPPITLIRTYTITDACGNYSSATQTITIDAPDLVFPEPDDYEMPACLLQDQVSIAV